MINFIFILTKIENSPDCLLLKCFKLKILTNLECVESKLCDNNSLSNQINSKKSSHLIHFSTNRYRWLLNHLENHHSYRGMIYPNATWHCRSPIIAIITIIIIQSIQTRSFIITLIEWNLISHSIWEKVGAQISDISSNETLSGVWFDDSLFL